MEYFYLQKRTEIRFLKDEISKVLRKEIENIDDSYVVDFNKNLLGILRQDDKCSFYTQNKTQIDDYHEDIFNCLRDKTDSIRSNILNNYLLNDNLSFLISNGCSLYAGSKAINKTNDLEYFDKINSFKSKYKYLNDAMQDLCNKRPEEVLDRLYEFSSYCENIIKDRGTSRKVNSLINEVKKEFVQKFVLSVNYNNNDLHKMFLKRLGFRNNKLNTVNIFTLNYDLLIEKSAEELGIIVNNGFSGFHNRVFMPSTFHLGLHINQSSGDRLYTKGINLFKLHGSISWKFDNKPPYGIIEQQKDYNNLTFEDIPDCIIYPVQSKKRYSLDLPYSEMFRQFIEVLNKPNSTLIVMGYSFLDEHVNDIITNALANPDFNLVVFTYQEKSDPNISDYLKILFERSLEDSRISIFSGNILGDFEYINRLLLTYPQPDDPEKILYKTLERLKNGD